MLSFDKHNLPKNLWIEIWKLAWNSAQSAQWVDENLGFRVEDRDQH